MAASNFFELLTIFDAKYLSPVWSHRCSTHNSHVSKDLNVSEKIKYTKWKASDIAKAFREGRVPQAGPAALYDGSEDELGDKMTASHSDQDEFSAISSYNVAGKSATVSSSTPPIEANEKAADDRSPSKPSLQTSSSSNTVDTVTPGRTTPIMSPTPKYINTSSAVNPYAIDASNPMTTAGSKTPMKTPGISDGLWSTAATPGIESPNMFSPFPGGSFGKAAASLMNPATLAKFNMLKRSDPSPISPISPKSRSGLSAMFIPPKEEDTEDKANSGNDTDEDDGQWSVGGNPMSRQHTMLAPGASFVNAPGVVVTPSLGAVQEEGMELNCFG